MNVSWTAVPNREALRWVVPASAAVLLCSVVWLWFTAETRSLVGVLTYLLPSVLSAAMCYLGYRFAAGSPEASHARTVFGWFLVGIITNTVAGLWFFVINVLDPTVFSTPAAMLTNLATGGLFGVIVGWYSVRARRTTEEATRARARQEHAERQRETLAVLDRALRHYLLNAMNVIGAHAEGLDGHTDTQGEAHREVIARRSEETAATVTDIRRAAEALQNANALETMDLVAFLETQLDRTRRSYPQATFETQELPENAEIVADHLLEDAIEEVLENAIVHAETDSPTVTVGIEASEEWTTVIVADDGPGVPERLEESVFEMAEYGPGGSTGMGLFLVRSIVDRYGGEVCVTDNEPRGARFSLRFPTP